MKTLVLCVDRDNDLGEKTGLGSPVIGRENCLNAASELGIKDPSETDTNAIFMAIKILDTLKREDKDAEISIITGHKYLGEKADRTIADQLDMVLDKVKPDRAILVSDGVSDEAMMPVLQSRVKIDHVHRFELKYRLLKTEEKLYAFMRYLKHDSIRIGIGIPVTLLMLFYGAFVLTGFADTTQNFPGGAILVAVSLFFLTRALLLQERLREYVKALRKDIKSASLSPIFALVAMIVLVIGSFVSFNRVDVETGWVATWEATLLFALYAVWWIVLSILLRIIGAFLDSYIRFRKIKVSFLNDAMQTVAFGFITYGALIGLNVLLGEYFQEKGIEFPVLEVAAYIIIGVITAGVSASVYRIIRFRMKKKTKVKVKSA